MDNQKVYILTLKLIQENQFLLNTYMNVRESGMAKDFFQDVRPYCDELKAAIDEWLPLAVLWVETNQPKHLFAIQLKNTAENLQMVSVRAFYPETSLKRFKSHIQSIDYVLNRLKDELEG
ncbi:YppE family protein [Bacillus ginsengihumi]|uniref:YppE family protein n=1 Tax=Heyndrickxia ginsengihumi TaxID=363870 RepID=A0A6M0P9H0_9BACI|nr:YppE family protein [Heyndrickxia ginsengihumi]NEY20550.1 YppE family protein [Heyndrickxia ginsengihumi]